MDWNQEQRITTRVNGKEVTHCLIPISDPHFLDYMDQRENLEQDEALVLFYNTFVDRLEGVKDLPEDWRMYLPASEKRDVAKRTLLHAQFLSDEEPETKDEDGLSFNDYVAIDRNERTYRLQTYFDGKKVIIPITLRLFTSKERKDLLRVLERETSSERFKVEYAAKVAREALIGSKPNLPIILLSAVALNHLVNDSVVIEKN